MADKKTHWRCVTCGWKVATPKPPTTCEHCGDSTQSHIDSQPNPDYHPDNGFERVV